MTDREIAEEYYYKTYPVTLNVGEENRKEKVINIFLDGLKTGKDMNVSIKWHDLRKDPNDLPLKMGIGSEVVLISYDGEVSDFAYYNFEAKRWEHDEDAFYICNPPPIAWCEIPKFEK